MRLRSNWNRHASYSLLVSQQGEISHLQGKKKEKKSSCEMLPVDSIEARLDPIGRTPFPVDLDRTTRDVVVSRRYLSATFGGNLQRMFTRWTKSTDAHPVPMLTRSLFATPSSYSGWNRHFYFIYRQESCKITHNRRLRGHFQILTPSSRLSTGVAHPPPIEGSSGAERSQLCSPGLTQTDRLRQSGSRERRDITLAMLGRKRAKVGDVQAAIRECLG